MVRVLVARNSGYIGVEVRALLSAHRDLPIVGTLPLDGDLAVRAATLAPDG